ncbi:DUF4198 domain-containing protein [Polaribacter sp. R77954]|uniref:DUF4198 domain-containing protein n=1 Tax=Polaribacter sp. R77954 TaxID=3093870 RepID=UPI0037C666BC
MRKKIFTILCILIFCSHDMYLKIDTFFLEPHTQSTINLFNGTFDKSENVITRDRMLDASLVGNGKRIKIEDKQWSEKDSITILNFTTENEGTWVAGVSTKPRNFAMTAQKFNDYLEHDGIKDVLSARKENNTIKDDAVEKYSKHVKAIFQVGEERSEDWKTVLGYPIEFVPLQNPYKKYTGDTLQLQLLRKGKPLANQLVYADFKATEKGHSHNNISSETHSHNETTHSHDDENHTHTTGQELRTNQEGIVSVKLKNDGIWYVRTIHLVNSEEEGLTHESNWATLTFEVTHHHNSATHSHTHADEDSLPSYIFIIASIVVVAMLFFFFNRKK